MKTPPRKINLTKTAIQAIEPPASGRTYTYDTKQPGLAVCTTAAGTKTFYLYRKVNGKPERIRLGVWPELTVEQAREAIGGPGHLCDHAIGAEGTAECP